MINMDILAETKSILQHDFQMTDLLSQVTS